MKTLAVMRPKNRLDESEQMARSAGFNPVCASPVEIVFNKSQQYAEFIDNLSKSLVDYLIITSTNGAEAMISLSSDFMSQDDFIKLISETNIIAIGPVSAGALSNLNIHVSEIPSEYSSRGIVESLSGKVKGKNVYILRSDHGDKILSQGLTDAGANVTDIPVYRLMKTKDEDLMNLARMTLAGEIDAFAFTSALSASSFIEAVCSLSDEAVSKINSATVAAIGYPTKERLESLGIKVDIVPKDATYSSMLDSLVAAFAHS
ncbi:uroporphyrinogen-III synthase [Candidatus Methanomassiliicoccus intestinalis]|uniref:uroporphyrinogen-III synthase n=1 Tax=Candidatus Methanomassiliicoccus intestinalis TaxID=1406512 RepID=UPI0037DC4020